MKSTILERRGADCWVGIALLFCSALWACSAEDGQSGESSAIECGRGENRVGDRCVSNSGRRENSDVSATDTTEDSETSAACAGGDQFCLDDETAVVCQPGGIELQIQCSSGQTCQDGSCVETGGCTPGSYAGCEDPHSYRLCDSSGEDFSVVDCPPEAPNCLAGLDECTTLSCVPRTTRCSPEEDSVIEICNEDGDSWSLSDRCDPGLTCESGACLSPCEENAKVASFLGCDYWALDLDNIEERCSAGECREGQTCNTTRNVCEPSAASQQFSVSVSNPNEEEITVTITNSGTAASFTETVAGQTAQSILLERLDVNGSGISRSGYHIETSLPVTVHQFNPSNNVGVFSNDASLLLPSNAGGTEYILVGWPTGPFGTGEHALSYAAVVAVGNDGPTTVTVTPSTSIQGGTGLPTISPGVATDVTLEYGQILSLQTLGTENADLSGTVLSSTQDILVFSGHECAFVPDSPITMFCDHMEQQLFPTDAWGTDYFLAKLAPRGTEVDVLRIVASQDNTALTTTPHAPGLNGLTLDRGEVFEYNTAQSFQITGTNPILVAQFLTGSNHSGIAPSCFNPLRAEDSWCTSSLACPLTCDRGPGYCAVRCTSTAQCEALTGGNVTCNDGYCAGATGIGDPAFSLAVPVNQFRDNYIFLTPADYREDWFTVVVPDGVVLTFDGEPLTTDGYIPIAETGYSYYHHPTSHESGADPAVAHTVTAEQPFGLLVYGYDCDVSYAYPGGLNLEGDSE